MADQISVANKYQCEKDEASDYKSLLDQLSDHEKVLAISLTEKSYDIDDYRCFSDVMHGEKEEDEHCRREFVSRADAVISHDVSDAIGILIDELHKIVDCCNRRPANKEAPAALWPGWWTIDDINAFILDGEKLGRPFLLAECYTRISDLLQSKPRSRVFWQTNPVETYELVLKQLTDHAKILAISLARRWSSPIDKLYFGEVMPRDTTKDNNLLFDRVCDNITEDTGDAAEALLEAVNSIINRYEGTPSDENAPAEMWPGWWNYSDITAFLMEAKKNKRSFLLAACYNKIGSALHCVGYKRSKSQEPKPIWPEPKNDDGESTSSGEDNYGWHSDSGDSYGWHSDGEDTIS